MSFQQFGLHFDLLKAIHQLGYQTPTPIQQQAIPLALAGRDLIGCAQTGTGKTAAFALPILNKLHSKKIGRTRALILTPTRELAAQINDVMQSLTTYTKLNSAAIYGGVGMQPQQKALRCGTNIIVATPGRLLDHMNQGIGRFDALEFFVLDEADRMLDMGFLPDVKRIIARLPQHRQTMMFSATMPREILQLSQQILRNPANVQVGRQATPVAGVSQSAYPVAHHLKTALLVSLLEKTQMASVLIFARTKSRTDRLTRNLNHSGFHATSIHGDRTQHQRQAALEGFRNRRYHILVATDIAARGLDVEGISHVINFDVPLTPEDYVHRIGRTARNEAIGEALTLVSPAEEDFLAAIQHLTRTSIPRQTVADFDYERNQQIHPSSGSRSRKENFGHSGSRKRSRRSTLAKRSQNMR